MKPFPRNRSLDSVGLTWQYNANPWFLSYWVAMINPGILLPISHPTRPTWTAIRCFGILQQYFNHHSSIPRDQPNTMKIVNQTLHPRHLVIDWWRLCPAKSTFNVKLVQSGHNSIRRAKIPIASSLTCHEVRTPTSRET